MREIVETIRQELRRLASEGEDAVLLDEKSIEILSRFAAENLEDLAQAAGIDTVAPVKRAADEHLEKLPEVKELQFADKIEFKKEDAMPKKKDGIKIVNSAAADFEVAPIPAPTPFTLPAGDKAARWQALEKIVLTDPVCNAHVKPGKKVVFGVGCLSAKIFFCGEAPGADEEIQGEPFVGKAGQLLTKIISAMGLSRQDVYIGNIMNWRPELPTSAGNRPPTLEEMSYCLPYLKAQIEIVNPQVVVALGATAVNGLLGPDPARRLGKIRGLWHDFEDRPLMITYHPSYLLQYGSPAVKRLVWEDMMTVMEKVGMEVSAKQRGFFLEK